MKRCRFALLFLCGAVALAGCSPKGQESTGPKSESLKLAPAHEAGNPAPTVSNEGLTFTPAPGWIEETVSSSNRQAQFKLPRAGGDSEDAELIVYYFPGGGGTPQANVDRWIGQFSGPDGSAPRNTARITRKSIGGIPLTVVDVSGDYTNSMMPMGQPGGSKANYRMLGVIAEAANGPWFIKLTGPAKTVAQWAPSFDTFLNSIRRK